MCTGMEIALLAGTALSTGAAIDQGNKQEDWAEYQAKQADADANAERAAATIEADKIRRLAKRQAAEANAALAKSGVNVGEGTALQINEEIYAGAEEDALMTIFGGRDRANRAMADADGYLYKGKQAKNASYLDATSTALAGGSNYGKGWKTK